jgi:hypothetical protein
MSNSGWYYASNNQRLGPVAIEQLRHLAAVGQLAPQDLVWTEGMADWQAASTVPGLFVASSPPPPNPYYHPPGPPAPLGYNYGHAPSGPSQNGMAIAGFVLSFFFAPLGLVFSWVALNGMKTSGNPEGKGLATAGLILSIIFCSVWCLWGVAVFSCFGVHARI